MAPAPLWATQQPACAARPAGSTRTAPAGCARLHSAPCQPSGMVRLHAQDAPSGCHSGHVFRVRVRFETCVCSQFMSGLPCWLSEPVTPWFFPGCHKSLSPTR